MTTDITMDCWDCKKETPVKTLRLKLIDMKKKSYIRLNATCKKCGNGVELNIRRHGREIEDDGGDIRPGFGFD